MPLVPALCTQCGAKLEVDSTHDAALCPHCNTPFITEKAINNYNTTHVTNIGNLHADVVNVSDERSRDNRAKSGDTFISLGDYEAAQGVFRKLADECPYDYRGWWGLIKVESLNFTDLELTLDEYEEVERLYSKVCTVATEEEKETVRATYENYHQEATNSLAARRKALEDLQEETKKKIERLDAECTKKKASIEARIKALSEEYKKMSAPSDKIFMVLLVGGTILAIIEGVIEGIGIGWIGLVVFLWLAIALGISTVLGWIFDGGYKEREKNIKEEKDKLNADLARADRECRESKEQLQKNLAEAPKNLGLTRNIGTFFRS